MIQAVDILKARVHEGRVVVGEALPEGAQVTILCRDDENIELRHEERAELIERLEHAQRSGGLGSDTPGSNTPGSNTPGSNTLGSTTIDYTDVDDMLRDVCQ